MKTESGNRKKHTSSMKWIRRVTGTDGWRVLLILCMETGQAVCSLAFAMQLRGFINSAVSGDAESFRSGALRLFGLLIVMIALPSALRFLKEYTSTSVCKKFRMRELQELLCRSYSQVTEIHSGEWMNRIDSDAAVVASGVTNIAPNVFSMIVRLAGALYLLVQLIPEVAWIIVPGGCALGFLTFLFRGKLKRMHREQQEAQGAFRIFLQERLENLLVIHSFSKEKDVLAEGSAKQEAYRRKHIARDNFSNICNVGFAVVMNGAYLLGICYCGYRILRGTMQYGTLIAVMNLVSQVQSPFANLSGYVPQYYAMLASAERLMEVESFADSFSEPPYDAEWIAEFYRTHLQSIRLKHLSFSYETNRNRRVVLKNFSAEIEKGSITAVTGPSGCGKSTLLKILMCMYPLEDGACVLSGDGTDVPLSGKWRGLYSYVPQGNQLMAGSVREVVTFGNPKRYSDEEGIWNALKVADADGFVSALPEQLDARLGEHGSGLSEGQLQRLAIARAVYAGRPILLLDESTSSLDSRTERKVLTNIRSMTAYTVVFVTHRKAPLEICDRQIDMGRMQQTE